MEKETLYELILNSWNNPIVFVDTDHIIRYLNEPAKKHFSKWGETPIF
jgi:nitrogen-specific signal transduction histidine kinase